CIKSPLLNLALYNVYMANVIVLAGGDSDEREISLLSGAAVANALQNAGHMVSTIDPSEGLDKQLSSLQQADVIFPALHGKYGEDGEVQQFLEEHKIPFVGADSRSSRLCFDKYEYTKLLEQRGIFVPKTELVDLIKFEQSALIKKPFVLKPNDGGSSIDTFIVRDVTQLDRAAIEDAFNRHATLLLQELIEGTETTVAVLGNLPLTVIEIIPPQDGEFDYENKYNGKTQEQCPPKTVSIEAQQAAQALAKTIHDATGCRDMSRTDIIITPDFRLCVLETNTIPGLTDQSLLPKAAAQAGISMPQLCDQLVQFALNRPRLA
ncbi:D-alanine--D-alanine ligase, partial [Candidatus Saccharibacteria bacterium]|nr:D-alanine--D-alanine ligase [Candidatus Saccharibacteria bacterium]